MNSLGANSFFEAGVNRLVRKHWIGEICKFHRSTISPGILTN